MRHEGEEMNIEKLLEFEEKRGFEDINAIRSEGIKSFLDEWVVTGLLGRGSFGNVYKITKPQMGVNLKVQECALKVCRVNSAEEGEERVKEIEMQQLLRGHPNAVQIEDYALISREHPRTSFLIIRMELLNPLPTDGMSENEVIKLGMDICSVLEKCSELPQKLVHCDIKPANILVDKDGRYKLGDFGTAKTLRATMTYTGNRGTPLYMAPEVSAYGTGYDCRCDIYSLGYTMLTMLNSGKHPYEDREGAVALMYTEKKIPHPAGVSSELMKIIRRMCEKSTSKRYQLVSELKHDLQKLEMSKQKDIAKRKAMETSLKMQNIKVRREQDIRRSEDNLSGSKERLTATQAALAKARNKKREKLERKAAAQWQEYNFYNKVNRLVNEGMSYRKAYSTLKKGEEYKNIRIGKSGANAIGKAVGIVIFLAFLVCMVMYIGKNIDFRSGAMPKFEKYGASSEYNKDKNNKAKAEDAFDNNKQTCWQNGKGAKGVGESLIAYGDKKQKVSYIMIRNGYQKNGKKDLYKLNSRAKDITILYEGGEKSFVLEDIKEWQKLELEDPIETTFVTIRIDSVYEGTSNEVCISDISFG